MAWTVRGMLITSETSRVLSSRGHDRCRDTVDDADLVDDGREVGPADHREPFAQVEDPNRVCVGVQDVLVTHAVLACALRDDRIAAHVSKLVCHATKCKLT